MNKFFLASTYMDAPIAIYIAKNYAGIIGGGYILVLKIVCLHA